MGKQGRRKALRAQAVPRGAPQPSALAAPSWSRTALVAAAAGVVALAVYAWTMAPDVTLVDSGELILAARDLGVAHPPGMPLWVLLAHLATRVPWGSVAQRVNAFSALCAAAATACAALAARAALDRPAAAAEARDSWRATVPSWTASLGLAFCWSLWDYATVAEVYALNLALLAAILLLMLLWRRRADDRWLLAAAALFGLALGVHHVTIGLALPAFAALVYGRAGAAFFRSRRLAVAAGVSIGCLLLVYALLPVAAARRPTLDWGSPDTLERIVWHVTGRQYQSFLSFSPEASLHEARVLLDMTLRQFGPAWLPVVLLLAAVGIAGAWRRDRPLAVALVLMAACNVAFGLSYVIAEDKEAYYLPTLLAACVAAALGCAELLSRARGRAADAVAAALLLVPLAPLAGNLRRADRSRDFVARDYASNLLDSIAPSGLLLTSDWQAYSPLLYVREIEGQRRDTAIVDVQLLRRSWYYAALDRMAPGVLAPVRPQVDAFLYDLNAWEHDPPLYERDPALNRRINERFYDMIAAFVSHRARTGPVYATRDVVLPGVTPDPELGQRLGRAYELVPHGLVFELASSRAFEPPARPAFRLRGLFGAEARFDPDDVAALKVRPAYLTMIVSRGLYLAAHGDAAGARAAYAEALSLDPGFEPARQAAARSAMVESRRP